MKLKLRKFSPQSEGGSGIFQCFVVLIGKRNSGKSSLLKSLLAEISDKIDVCMGFSPTDDCNGVLSEIIPSGLVHRDLSESALQNLCDVQREQWKRGHGSEVALILDDMAHERKIFDSRVFKSLAFNSRHLHLTVFITLQEALSIGPAIRTNCDVIFTLAERMMSNRKRLYENFFGMTSFLEFCAILDKCTENYESLVLYNKTQSNDISESMFWYKADIDLPRRVQMCKKPFLKIHEHFSAEEQGAESKRFPAGSAIDHIVQADEEGCTKVVTQAREVELPELEDTKSFGFSNYRENHGSDDLISDAFAFDTP